MTTYRAWPSTDPGTSSENDTTEYTLGVAFTVDSDVTAKRVWFYSGSGSDGLPDAIGIFAQTSGNAGTLIESDTSPSWSGSAGDGWVSADLSNTTTLSSGTIYKACIQKDTSQFVYSATGDYFNGGAGAAGIDNGPLHILSHNESETAFTTGQDTFADSVAVLTWPHADFNNANYWVDIEVDDGGGSGVTGTGSVSIHKLGLSGAGSEKDAGTGSVALHKMGLSGAGTPLDAGTGSVALHKMSLSGSGTPLDAGTGSVALHKLGLSGSGGEKNSGSGSVALHKMSVSGSQAVVGNGSVALHKMSLSGTGNAPLIGSGSVALHKMGLDGSGDVQGTVSGSGSVALKKMGLAGSGTAPVVGTGSVALKKMGVQGSNLVAPPTLDASLLAGTVTAAEYGGTLRAVEYAGAVSAQEFGGHVR